MHQISRVLHFHRRKPKRWVYWRPEELVFWGLCGQLGEYLRTDNNREVRITMIECGTACCSEPKGCLLAILMSWCLPIKNEAGHLSTLYCSSCLVSTSSAIWYIANCFVWYEVELLSVSCQVLAVVYNNFNKRESEKFGRLYYHQRRGLRLAFEIVDQQSTKKMDFDTFKGKISYKTWCWCSSVESAGFALLYEVQGYARKLFD